MYFTYSFHAVVYYLILSFYFSYCRVAAVTTTTTTTTTESPDEEITTTEPEIEEVSDVYTFVALIEVLFTNGTKKTCTGSIIHEKVVITAGHCFVVEDAPWILPELTASFVVIGSRLMFESGYEQYLPIEKVITHPQFRGWTADLALVYTFAVMTADKPGQIIPIAGNRSLTPVDSNVTVLSWGYCKGTEDANVRTSEHGGSAETDDSDSPEIAATKAIKNRKPTRGIDFDEYPPLAVTHKHKHISNKERKHNSRKEIQSRKQQQAPDESEAFQLSASNLKYMQKQSHHPKPKEKQKRYQQILRKDPPTKYKQMTKSAPNQKPTKRKGSKYLPTNEFGRNIRNVPKKVRKGSRSSKRVAPALAGYKNWRRVMGSQGQNLSVEVFNFVNVQTCKKLIQKVKPSTYSINNKNEVLCYSSDDYFITNEDAGAPAIQQNNLVAVTIGGVEADGDHVAIGMKMSCFCLWIAENLPDNDGDEIACCLDCCETEHFEKTTTLKKKIKRKRIGRQGAKNQKTFDYYGIQRFSGGEGNEEVANQYKTSDSKEDSSRPLTNERH